AFVKERAEQLAPGLDWEKPKLEDIMTIQAGNSMPANLDATHNETGGVVKRAEPGRKSSDAVSEKQSGRPDRTARPVTNWFTLHPTNYYALMERGKLLVTEKEFERAKAPLQRLLELYPTQTGQESAYEMLAGAHRALGETNSEREVLAKFVQ